MKKYQVFISSTYTDLVEERKSVLETILKQRHIPVGMENFVAANDSQFNYIKAILDETDYYVLIVGNRYGSTDENGVSYTEKEFDYAVEKEIPIIACIKKDPATIPMNKSDVDPIKVQKLNAFREKVEKNRLVSLIDWDTPEKLSLEVSIALKNMVEDNPRPGWERVGKYDNASLLEQLNDLRIENATLTNTIKENEEGQQCDSLVKDKRYTISAETISLPFEKEKYKTREFTLDLSFDQVFSVLSSCIFFNGSSGIDSIKSSFESELGFRDVNPRFIMPDLDFTKILLELESLNLVHFSNAEDYDMVLNSGEQVVALTSEGRKKSLSCAPLANEVITKSKEIIREVVIQETLRF